MQLAVLVNGATNKPLIPATDVRLSSRESPVKPIRDKVLGISKRRVLPIDDNEGKPGSWRARPLNQGGIRHPKPEPVDLQWTVSGQAHGEHSDLAELRDVLQRVSIEQPSGGPGAQGSSTARQNPVLSMQRDAIAPNEFPSFDLCATRPAPEMVSDEVPPAPLSRSKPAGWNQKSGDDLEAWFTGLIEERYIVLISESWCHDGESVAAIPLVRRSPLGHSSASHIDRYGYPGGIARSAPGRGVAG